MDDYLDSLKTPQELLKLSQALKLLLSKGEFKLTKFVCNVNELADELNGNTEPNEKQNEEPVDPPNTLDTKVGPVWLLQFSIL